MPDPRGHAEEPLSNPNTLTLLRALRDDVSDFAEGFQTNHPIGRQIASLNKALVRGVAGFNPVEVGYQLEVISSYVPDLSQFIADISVARIRAIAAGGTLLVRQFPEWREVVAASERQEAPSDNLRLAEALRALSNSIHGFSETIDKRVALSLEIQSEDLSEARSSPVVAQGAANSTSNLMAALAGKLWTIGKGGASKAGDEALKFYVRKFLEANQGNISNLINQAPRTLGWLKEVIDSLLN